mmetsp:Transcript_23708/g.32436  ORF Transcript_23708/g.32436 Transcript_23708/m.32436 type:complete len:279 (+) Transcript_23708:1254-2090(+)
MAHSSPSVTIPSAMDESGATISSSLISRNRSPVTNGSSSASNAYESGSVMNASSTTNDTLSRRIDPLCSSPEPATSNPSSSSSPWSAHLLDAMPLRIGVPNMLHSPLPVSDPSSDASPSRSFTAALISAISTPNKLPCTEALRVGRLMFKKPLSTYISMSATCSLAAELTINNSPSRFASTSHVRSSTSVSSDLRTELKLTATEESSPWCTSMAVSRSKKSPSITVHLEVNSIPSSSMFTSADISTIVIGLSMSPKRAYSRTAPPISSVKLQPSSSSS